MMLLYLFLVILIIVISHFEALKWDKMLIADFGNNEVHYVDFRRNIIPLFICALFVACFVLFIILNLVAYYVFGPDNLLITILLTITFYLIHYAAFAYCAVYFFNYYLNYRLVLRENDLLVVNVWGKSTMIRWDEITTVYYNRYGRKIKITTRNGEILRFSFVLYDYGLFREQLFKHHPLIDIL